MSILSNRNVQPHPDEGTVAERPDAAERQDGFRYYATDEDVLYEAQDGTWIVSGDADPVGGLYKIAEVTLTGTSTTLDFASIPQDFKTLKLFASVRGNQVAAFSGVNVNVNNDTSDANYYHERFQGNAATASALENLGAANSRSCGLIPANSAAANHFGQMEITVHDYAATKIKPIEVKTIASWATTTGGLIHRLNTLVRNNTEPVNRLTLQLQNGSFVAGSTASLYGVKSAFI